MHRDEDEEEEGGRRGPRGPGNALGAQDQGVRSTQSGRAVELDVDDIYDFDPADVRDAEVYLAKARALMAEARQAGVPVVNPSPPSQVTRAHTHTHPYTRGARAGVPPPTEP